MRPKKKASPVQQAKGQMRGAAALASMTSRAHTLSKTEGNRTLWYDLTPAQYADGLRYSAERSDKSAARKLAEAKSWSASEAEHFTRQAKRLRAMAALCDASTAARAGGVDFFDMHNPAQSRETEDAAIARVELLTRKG